MALNSDLASPHITAWWHQWLHMLCTHKDPHCQPADHCWPAQCCAGLHSRIRVCWCSREITCVSAFARFCWDTVRALAKSDWISGCSSVSLAFAIFAFHTSVVCFGGIVSIKYEMNVLNFSLYRWSGILWDCNSSGGGLTGRASAFNAKNKQSY